MTELLRDRGSFRDPGNRVFDAPDAVYRVLNAEAAAEWRALAASRLGADPRIVATDEVDDAPAPWASHRDSAVDANLLSDLRGVLVAHLSVH